MSHRPTRILAAFAAASTLAVVLAPRAAAQDVEIISGGQVEHRGRLEPSLGPAIRVVTRTRADGTREYEAVQPLTSAEVLAVQRSLTDLGLDPGPHDGLFGPRLERGLRVLQGERGLTVCGCLDGATLRALRLRPRVVRLASVNGAGIEFLFGGGSSSDGSRRPDGVEILAPPLRPVAAVPVAAPSPDTEPGEEGRAPTPVVGFPVWGFGPHGALRVAPKTGRRGGRPLGGGRPPRGGAGELRRVAPPGTAPPRGGRLPSRGVPRGSGRTGSRTG